MTAISVTVGMILGLLNLGNVAEPYWIATRQFTRELVRAAEVSTSSRLMALEIASKESQRDAAQSKLDSLDLELRKNSDASDGVKALLNNQVRRYTEQLRILNLELDDLYRQRSGRKP